MWKDINIKWYLSILVFVVKERHGLFMSLLQGLKVAWFNGYYKVMIESDFERIILWLKINKMFRNSIVNFIETCFHELRKAWKLRWCTSSRNIIEELMPSHGVSLLVRACKSTILIVLFHGVQFTKHHRSSSKTMSFWSLKKTMLGCC